MNPLRINFGRGPWVAGTLSSFEGTAPVGGDLVEVRLDKTGVPADWVERCRAIQDSGRPVLLTIRLRREGGQWPDERDADRLALYRDGLAAVAAVDAELNSASAAELAALAAERGAACVLSWHDFKATPPSEELEATIEQAHALGAVAKIAATIRGEADAERLRALLRRRWARPLCVIGMGEAWKQTRVEFAKMGSCLTYGYLDHPTAPGQISAVELGRLVHGN